MDTITMQPMQRLAIPAATGLGALVGNTPLIPLNRITAGLPEGVQIMAKAEWFNPSGSVKDRPAWNILRTALATGALGPGRRLLDSTSGNMGIAYATLGAALGVPVTLALPANASPERVTILRALGAELVLTDPLEGTDGAQLTARQMAGDQPELYFYANQYDNPANWQAHYLATGPEIVQQTGGRITHLVAGMGTSGTLTGAGRALLEFNPAIEIIAVQPDSPLHAIEGLKHMPSAVRPGFYDPDLAGRTMVVSSEEAQAMARRLAREEGLFVGVSAGAAVAASLTLASELEQGCLVAILPDAGYKYLSDGELWKST